MRHTTGKVGKTKASVSEMTGAPSTRIACGRRGTRYRVYWVQKGRTDKRMPNRIRTTVKVSGGRNPDCRALHQVHHAGLSNAPTARVRRHGQVAILGVPFRQHPEHAPHGPVRRAAFHVDVRLGQGCVGLSHYTQVEAREASEFPACSKVAS